MTHWLRAFAVLAMLAGQICALDVPGNVSTGEFVRVVHEPGAFIKITPARNESQIVVTEGVTYFTGTPGVYEVQEVYRSDAGWVENVAAVSIGTAPPPPIDPPVPPAPIPTGVRTLVILHETEDDTPEFARLAVSLRTGEAAKYLAEHGHALLILDDDVTDQLGRPLKLVQELSALKVPLPSIFILNADTGALMFKGTLTPNANWQGVIKLLKEHGG